MKLARPDVHRNLLRMFSLENFHINRLNKNFVTCVCWMYFGSVCVSLRIADQDRLILRGAKTNGNFLGSNLCRSSAAR